MNGWIPEFILSRKASRLIFALLLVLMCAHCSSLYAQFDNYFGDSVSDQVSDSTQQSGFNTEITPGASDFSNPLLLHTDISDPLHASMYASVLSPLVSGMAQGSVVIGGSALAAPATDVQQLTAPDGSPGRGAGASALRIRGFSDTSNSANASSAFSTTASTTSNFNGASSRGAFNGQMTASAFTGGGMGGMKGGPSAGGPAASLPSSESSSESGSASPLSDAASSPGIESGDGSAPVSGGASAASATDPVFTSALAAVSPDNAGSFGAAPENALTAANAYFRPVEDQGDSGIATQANSSMPGLANLSQRIPGSIMPNTSSSEIVVAGFPDSTNGSAGSLSEYAVAMSPLEHASMVTGSSPFRSLEETPFLSQHYLNPTLHVGSSSGKPRLSALRRELQQKQNEFGSDLSQERLRGLARRNGRTNRDSQERPGEKIRSRLRDENGITQDPLLGDTSSRSH